MPTPEPNYALADLLQALTQQTGEDPCRPITAELQRGASTSDDDAGSKRTQVPSSFALFAAAVQRRLAPAETERTAQHEHRLALRFSGRELSDEAVPHFEHALRIRKSVLPADHVKIAQTANNLAVALHKLRRFDEALPHREEALRVRTAQVPVHDLQVALASPPGEWLAAGGASRHCDVLSRLQHPGKSKPLLAVARSHSRAALTLAALHRHEDALAHRRSAQSIVKALHRDESPQVAQAAHEVAQSLHKLGRSSEALAHAREALRLRRLVLTGQDCAIAESESVVGLTLFALGHFGEALAHHKEALRMREALLPRGHVDIVVSRHNVEATSFWLDT